MAGLNENEANSAIGAPTSALIFLPAQVKNAVHLQDQARNKRLVPGKNPVRGNNPVRGKNPEPEIVVAVVVTRMAGMFHGTLGEDSGVVPANQGQEVPVVVAGVRFNISPFPRSRLSI